MQRLYHDAMTVLLCTSKYRAAFNLPDTLVAADDAENGLLGPWYAHTLNIGPQRYLQYMSSVTLLPVLIWRRERDTAEERMRAALRRILEQIGIDPRAIDAELHAMSSLVYARAADRSRLASLRDQATTAKHRVQSRFDTEPERLSLELLRMPCGAMGYQTPREATRARFAAR